MIFKIEFCPDVIVCYCGKRVVNIWGDKEFLKRIMGDLVKKIKPGFSGYIFVEKQTFKCKIFSDEI
jgi:hypothetical protein